VSGFRDYLPSDAIPRQKILDTVRGVFELFGFEPLETPGVEKEEILTGGDPDFKKEIFRISTRGEKEKDIALRFDLTVPLARVVAQYRNEIKRPFKRYQVGPVWRGERPQFGRYREFIQCDADIVGSSSMMADAEIIAVIYESMTALGLKNFQIRINNRKILNGLPEYIGFSADAAENVLRSIDKLGKQGWTAVSSELAASKKENGANLTKKQIEKLKSFLEIKDKNQIKVLEKVLNTSCDLPIVNEGVEELKQVIENLRALGVPSDKWVIDLSVARGLGYYTGPVFECVIENLEEVGSIFGGGRYDGLVKRFSSVSVPATGVSLGIDRLFSAMEKLGFLSKQKTISRVIVLNFERSCESYCAEIATLLRKSGISTEVYMGSEKTLRGQLAYAVRNEIPVVLIAGGGEKKKKSAQVKNMKTREQKEIKVGEIAKFIQNILEN